MYRFTPAAHRLRTIMDTVNESFTSVTNRTESGDSVEPNAAGLPVDPSITYPSYKSLDQFIDVERLRSLDGYITQRLKRRLRLDADLKFYTGPYTVAGAEAGRPGSRMVYLSHSERADNYFDLDKTELWHPTENANDFSLLMDFIRTLPFKATGRMLIMYDDEPREVPAHRDHVDAGVCHEFIWFRTNLRKPFFMLSEAGGSKQYVKSYSAWFDTVNQYHGSEPYSGLAFSIRVDGKFTDEFRAQIPSPTENAASTPSYWAASES
jgi:hypothetical protein